MSRLNEETLNAYADGALSADARAEVEALLATDAAARDLLEKLRSADALARRAFAAPMHEPPPQALVDAILKGAGREGALQSVVPPRVAWPRARGIRDYALPIAATLVLAAGIAASLLFGRQPNEVGNALALGPVADGSRLHRLLESTPGGRILEVDTARGDIRGHTVVATFRDRHARVCREVEVLARGSGQVPLAAAVACRGANGGWTVEGAVRLAVGPGPGGQGFEPSGVSERDALEGLLAMLGAQTALPPEEEQSLMLKGWK